MKTVHILHWVGDIAGLGVLALGLIIWIIGVCGKRWRTCCTV
ncbi:hypothetical protein [Ktedonospora formicarum]|nr:hypothetical protein [Ktedonospora formicarum]